MKRLDHYWYDKNPLALALLPLSWLFRLLSAARRAAYRHGIFKVHQLKVPVIVVGNISIGGSGKTPLVIWLAQFLKDQGYTPAIVSRGYGGITRDFPQRVLPDSDPAQVGDEAVLLAQRCGCPVVIDPDRVHAARSLAGRCNVIISDDGLQHYALGRRIEIAVVDAARWFGNGFCLPAGPLREVPERLASVDLVVSNGVMTELPAAGLNPQRCFSMRLVEQGMVNLLDNSCVQTVEQFQGKHVHAVAGIGNPARFFTQLKSLGFDLVEHSFPDHHRFTANDLEFTQALPLIMTEKDAVKCSRFAQSWHWFMPVQAQLPTDFGLQLLYLLKRKIDGQKTA